MDNTEIEKRYNFKPLENFKQIWIEDKIDSNGIDFLDYFGFFLCDKIFVKEGKKIVSDGAGKNAITSSQIRNIFGEIKRIEMKVADDDVKWEEEKPSFLLLRPKIAYNTARVLAKERASKMKDLKNVLDKAHNCVQTIKQLKNFSNFFEGILAYHKAYGGKDK